MVTDSGCPHDIETLVGMVRCIKHTAEDGRAIDPVCVLRLVRFHERVAALADELENLGGNVCWEVAQILREALEQKEKA